MLREQGAVRSRSAYDVLDPPAKAHFEARYVVPSETTLAAAATAIREVNARIWAIVPMAEQQPELAMTVKQAARYLSARLPAGRVLFLDGGSCPENVAAARAGGAMVVKQDQIFDAVDWNELLPLLNLRRRPVGRAGQGFNVFAAHLTLAALGVREGDLVLQCDADVENYEELAPLERLIPACSQTESVRHAKLAQPGRNNEITMVARTTQQLFHILELPWVPPAVKQLSRKVFQALAPDKWLTCGIYVITGAIALSRPFASGYLDATTQALWTVEAPACGWRDVRFVECPVSCRDAKNTTTKDTLMLSSIALYLQSIVMCGKAPDRWSFSDIAELNRDVMPRLCDIPEIGDADGPVVLHRIQQDRIIPPVRALCEAGLIDLAAAAEVVAGASRDAAA